LFSQEALGVSAVAFAAVFRIIQTCGLPNSPVGYLATFQDIAGISFDAQRNSHSDQTGVLGRPPLLGGLDRYKENSWKRHKVQW
ncbi:MAG TPA: hypothetical protein VFS12_13990, partial [Terriglobia bacterium]|nr:hypothetical protein [Terriglobia bacterium]